MTAIMRGMAGARNDCASAVRCAVRTQHAGR